MSGIDIFAWLVLLVILASIIYVIVFLGLLPGKVASQRNHPYAEAIAIGSWLGLFIGFVGWAVILVWAYAPPRDTVEAESDESGDLEARLASLEARLAITPATGALVDRIDKLEAAAEAAGGDA